MKPNDKAIEAAILAIKENGPYYAGSKIRESMAKHLAEVALPPAYAAQFQSDEYADVIKSLRVMHDSIITDAKEQFRDGIHETMPSKAADAIEAVLAKRDALKAANNELREENELVGKQMDRFADQIEALENERDALAARLAPVDDEALVEIVADAINDGSKNIARAAIAAIRPHIEAAERDRCAKKILETNWVDADPEEIAAAIRSGK